MASKIVPTALFILLLILIASAVYAERGRIYGRIHTHFGDQLEGPIRWDKNEASWDDIIDANKERTPTSKNSKRRRYRTSGNTISIFGLKFVGDGDTWWGSSSQSGIAFGHIKTLTPTSDNSAELLLKSGKTVELESGSTDLGNSVREIVIEDINEGELELEWDDIDYIEFFDGGEVESDFGNRIYGTVTTSRAGEFTGWICWDMDEMFSIDILDGREKSRKRKIKFAKIARIEKISSQASMVETKNGKKMRLDDSNDIDSGNRGIVVSDLNMGRVVVEWDEFESLDIEIPASDAYPNYDRFDGGRRLYGTVFDEDGEKFTGFIRWDDDEEYTWELLNGTYRGIDFDIPFEHIESIEKLSRRSSRVTLNDGRQFRLRDSNDVNDENKGIIIWTDKDGDEEIIDWEDFSRVEFSRR